MTAPTQKGMTVEQWGHKIQTETCSTPGHGCYGIKDCACHGCIMVALRSVAASARREGMREAARAMCHQCKAVPPVLDSRGAFMHDTVLVQWGCPAGSIWRALAAEEAE